MAREIKIPIALDAGAVEKSVRNDLIDPLDDAGDAFKKLEKAAKNADLDTEIDKAAKATSDYEDEIDDARKALKELGYGAKKVGSESREGMGEAGKYTGEFRDEAMQNFSEVTSSFSGDMASAVDGIQGTLGGLASGIGGPLGIALGGAAIGVGAIAQGFIQAKEKAEELREKTAEIAAEAVREGVNVDEFLTAADQVADRIEELETLKSEDFKWFWEEDVSQLEDWAGALNTLGRDTSEIGKVLSSTTKELKNYRDATDKAREAAREQAREARGKYGDTSRQAGEIQKQVDAYNELVDTLDNEISVREQSAESAKLMKDAGMDAALAAIDAAELQAEANDLYAETAEEAQASVVDAYDNMRDAANAFATDEDGALDINRWLEYVTQHQEAVANYEANLQQMKLTPEQWANLMEMPEDSRMQWVNQFVAMPENARQPFADALNDVAGSAADQAAVSFDSSFNPKAEATVKVTTDTEPPKKKLGELVGERTAKITAKTSGDVAAKSVLDKVAAARTAIITASASTSQADRDLAYWRSQQSYRPIYVDVVARPGKPQIV